MNFTVLMPCFQGSGTGPGQLVEQIEQNHSNVKMIVACNGVDVADVPEDRPRITFLHSEPGLRNALWKGWETFVESEMSEDPLVRADDAEHPFGSFEALAKRAVEINGVVCGSLKYSEELMKAESPDGLADQLWGAMYNVFTDGKIKGIGNAMGLLAFANGHVVKTLLETARPILEAADEQNGKPIQWAQEALLLLAAIASDTPMEVTSVDAELPRNRPTSKIVDQTTRHMQVIRAAISIYPEQFGLRT